MSDFTEIKQISIVDFLSQRGHRWVMNHPKNASYLSPFRNESHPSFVVNKNRNTWRDFGDTDPKSSHGDVIALVMRIDNVSFTEALEVLGHTKIVPIKHHQPIEKKKEIELVSVSELTDRTLLSYITIKRGINVGLAKRYCKQVEYSFPNGKYPYKTYLSVGFKNSLGGFELRNEVVKLSTDPKCFSVFEGEESECNIFEGFINLLSYLTYLCVDHLPQTTYVLNGTGMINVLLPFLKGKKVNLYVDNDRGGNSVLTAVKNAGLEYEDRRGFYEYYPDLNDFLLSKK